MESKEPIQRHYRSREGDIMKLTDQQIEGGKSSRGGWTRKTLADWGVPWPPPKGWRTALRMGTPIPARQRSRARARHRGPRPGDLQQLERHVYRLAAFLIERGHHDAADETRAAETTILGAG